MLFTSFTFVLFFVFIFLFYWLLNQRLQNVFVLLASCFFYGFWDWRFLGLVVLYTVVNFFGALAIERSRDEGFRRRILVGCLVFSVGTLGFFKYYNFFADSLISLLQFSGIPVHGEWLLENIILPVGISFYAFHTMSYTIDVYRRHYVACTDFIAVAAFIAFFPLLLAGPIERSGNLLDQIRRSRFFNADKAIHGLLLISWGVFKKIVIADNLAIYVNWVFDSSIMKQPYSGEALAGLFAFSFQIYADFSAYSDIAVGCAMLLGFDLIRNFNMPYISASFREFWSRWHISLSTWMRDYIYIPLGGNRGTPLRNTLNVFITMTVSGLWHGAAWTFVCWGMLHALYMIVERGLVQSIPAAIKNKKAVVILSYPLRWLIVTVGVVVGWSLFRATNMVDSARIWYIIFSFDGQGTATDFAPILGGFVAILFFSYCIAYINRTYAVRKWIKYGVYSVLLIALNLSAWFLAAPSQQPFVYFQF